MVRRLAAGTLVLVGIVISPSCGTADHVTCRNGVSIPGVVQIQAIDTVNDVYREGAGIVVDGSGVVLTVSHILEGADTIDVGLPSGGATYSATVLGFSREFDVAVLQLRDVAPLPAVSVGDSAGIRKGDAVSAVVNPGGFGGPLDRCFGDVTGLDASIDISGITGLAYPRTGLIDTSMHAGLADRGGALLDSIGHVVGLLDKPKTDELAYAIPINRAMAIAEQIRAGSSSDSVHVGPPATLGITVNRGGSGQGVVVREVPQGSLAADAGLTAGDVIVSMGGIPTPSPYALVAALDRRAAGDEVEIVWLDRTGAQRSAKVTLRADGTGLPDDTPSAVEPLHV